MDEREFLFQQAEEYAIPVDRRWSTERLKKTLEKAGIEVQGVAPVESEMKVSDKAYTADEVKALLAGQEEDALLAKAGVKRADPPKEDKGRVKIVVLRRKVHIQYKDLGLPDDSGRSKKFNPGDQAEVPVGLAKSMVERRQAAIVS